MSACTAKKREIRKIRINEKDRKKIAKAKKIYLCRTYPLGVVKIIRVNVLP